ncbi:MAG: GldG family protein [Clostridiales bacterium]|nr:GldG family protein [Clostridiales bacterium]
MKTLKGLSKEEKKNREPKERMSLKESLTTRSFRAGGYSAVAAALLLVILVAVNVVVRTIPVSITKIDMTSNQLYSISEETEKMVGGLLKDVTIYWVVQSGQEDSNLGRLLEQYTSLSDKISLKKKDPDVYPTFLQKYDVEDVYNNSLLVESGDRYRYVDANDIYEYDYSNYYTTGSYDVSFNGENAVTSAINYVMSEDLPKLYILTGHGETELSSAFSKALTDGNIETESLSLLTVDSVPEDADAVLALAPASDISDGEKEILQTYLREGGNFVFLSNPPEEGTLKNWAELMADYGVEAEDGIVMEGNSGYYASGAPFYLLPELEYHEITSPLSESGYRVLLPISQGLKIAEELPEGVAVDSLLTTSDDAYSKVDGYNLSTYEKEDNDLDGPFSLAVAITNEVDEDTTGKIIWIGSGSVIDEQTNMQVSGGNQDLFLNAINWICEKQDSIAIHAKSLSYEYLTINSRFASVFTIVIVALIPLCCIAAGIMIWVRRRRR